MDDETQLRPWPADAIERWRLDRIQPYANNARLHSDEQIDQIAASMTRWGVTTPVLVDEDGVLIYGHGRLRAAQKLGYRELPVAIARGWSEDEKRAYRIADNQLSLNSSWDIPLLTSELGLLRAADFDLPLLGFETTDLHELLDSNPGQVDPDFVPPVPEKPTSRAGDLWLLGRHRLLCGDATEAKDVRKLLAGEEPPLMVTDPPYGVDYDPSWRHRAKVHGKQLNRSKAIGKVLNDDRADWRAAWALFPGAVIYCWHASVHASEVEASLAAADFQIVSQIIWAKNALSISRGDYHWQHEPCWYAVRKGHKHHWQGDRTQTTLWTISRNALDTLHGTQKPIECMQRPIVNNSEPGEAVYDPFVGSGTTIIAAERTGRRCFAMELNPAYVDVALQRWQAFAGAVAKLDGDGRSFAAVTEDRNAPSDRRKSLRGKRAMAAKRAAAVG